MNAPAQIRQVEPVPATFPVRYRLRTADYMLLHEQGCFSGQETELIDGEIHLMSPEWRPHVRVKSELAYLLRRAVEDADLRYFVAIEGSLALSDTDMPRPDVLLTSEIVGDGAVPCSSVPLIVEVSSTTINDDLGAKAARYALAGVPEYWVADVNGRVIHQLWAPADGTYAERREIAFGQQVASIATAGLAIATDAL